MEEKSYSRNIPVIIQNALWAISAGRCEICGKKIYIEEKTNTLVNLAQKAHIHAFSQQGPRYSKSQSNPHVLDNLMLLCMEDHKLIDDHPDLYTAEILKKQKSEFEAKVSAVVDTQRSKSSILFFRGGITEHDTIKQELSELSPVLLNNGDFFNGKYYSILVDILGIPHDEVYFSIAKQTIKKQINEIKPSLKDSGCVSVFGLAPSPLLVYLGFLLNDESNIKVYQRFREGTLKWDWKTENQTNEFLVEQLILRVDSENEVNIILSISAEIAYERVKGKQPNHTLPTFVIRAKRQAFDAVSSEIDADIFIKKFRENLIEKIRIEFPNVKVINFFMAAPVSILIKIGMNYQKNVDVEWRLFDQQQKLGFINALSIKGDD
ncbi:MAG: HNH endonuclease [Vagococcus sp.]|uniref:HNH endonuclease n=1 Tax=Vagococcus sp. TaxID=1933889 RepID=UPI002FC819BD